MNFQFAVFFLFISVVAIKLLFSTDSKNQYCSMCSKEFVADKNDEDVSVYCTHCTRYFHSVKCGRMCDTEKPIPKKGFLCNLCTQQKKYPEIQQNINNRCKDVPTVFKYHNSNLTNY